MTRRALAVDLLRSRRAVSLFLLMLLTAPPALDAQAPPAAANRDSLIAAARDLMGRTTYCALVTTDSLGRPHARTMNPFPPDSTLIVRFATNRASRKVQDILHHPQVCVYWANHVEPQGYVCLTGTARIIDDRDELLRRRREYWDSIPNWQEVMVLIEIVPSRLEVLHYQRNLNNDPNTWQVPSIDF